MFYNKVKIIGEQGDWSDDKNNNEPHAAVNSSSWNLQNIQ